MKKTMLLMKPMLILAMILSLGLTSCKKGWFGDEDGPGKGGNNGGGGNTMLTKGTIVTQGCGKSIYGDNLWIKTDDGQLLQPCAQSFQTLCPIDLKEGDRVELKYHKYTGDYSEFEIYCKMAYFYFTRVTIDFITKTNNDDCPLVHFLPDYDKINAANLSIIDAKISGNKLIMNIGFSGCDNNTKRFELIAKPMNSNGMLTYEVKLTDEKPQMCEAFFTQEICFDISAFKYLIDGHVNVKIVGFDNVLVY